MYREPKRLLWLACRHDFGQLYVSPGNWPPQQWVFVFWDNYVIQLLEKAVIFTTKSYSFLFFFFLANVASVWKCVRQDGVPLTKTFLWSVSKSQRLMINTRGCPFTLKSAHNRCKVNKQANWHVLPQQLSNCLKELQLAHQNGVMQPIIHVAGSLIPGRCSGRQILHVLLWLAGVALGFNSNMWFGSSAQFIWPIVRGGTAKWILDSVVLKP